MPWRHALAGVTLPESLRGAVVDYRFRRCADDVIYVQFNRAADTPDGATLATWSQRLLGEIARRPPRRLVFDLRFNTGGDLTKARPLVDALAASPLGRQRGAIVVLSDVTTFSAGITPLAVLRGTSQAVVVGRPPGDGMHPQKTQVVYCRDGKRKGTHGVYQFDFLGYRFRPRFAKSRAGAVFLSFLPAISPSAAKAIRQTVRRWRLHCRHPTELADMAQEINPVLRGWLNYYGRFYRSALHAVFDTLDQYLVRWVRRKYKRLKFKVSRARSWWSRYDISDRACSRIGLWRRAVGNRSRMR